MTGRGNAEEDSYQALNKPFTVEEMRKIIKRQANTVPGLAGMTYQISGLI
jgi:hypothetical protein